MSDAQRGPWRCFHCGDVFTDAREAAAHFGIDQLQEPGCVEALRGGEAHLLRRTLSLQEELARYYAEDTDLLRWQAEHAARAEAGTRDGVERAYARGIAEGRAALTDPREHLIVPADYRALTLFLRGLLREDAPSLPVRWWPFLPHWDRLLGELSYGQVEEAVRTRWMPAAFLRMEPRWAVETFGPMIRDVLGPEA